MTSMNEFALPTDSDFNKSNSLDEIDNIQLTNYKKIIMFNCLNCKMNFRNGPIESSKYCSLDCLSTALHVKGDMYLENAFINKYKF